MKALKDTSITIEGIKNAELFFDLDIGSLKGNTIRNKHTPVLSNYIEIPREPIRNHHEVTLCINTTHINGLAFLATISRIIIY
jgi:hypothetical protein